MNSKLIVEYSGQLGLDIDGHKAELMAEYGRLLLEKNKDVNLTAVTDEREFIVKHLCDSLTVATQKEVAGEVADVGTGGGFPGVVIKILRPELSLTLIDSVQKKLAAVAGICGELGIVVETVHGRAEELGAKECRDRFDTVTARALARMPRLLEYCLPLVKKDGFLLAMKGPLAEEEIKAARRAAELLRGTLIRTQSFDLPDGIKRTVVVYKKTGPTPKEFPRTSKRINVEPV